METRTDTTQEPARCQQPIVLPLSHDRDEFAEECRRKLASKIHQHPSKGVTIKASYLRE